MGSLLLVVLTALTCGRKHDPAGPPPPVVSVAPAAAKTIPVYLEFAGTLDGYVNADVRARVAGTLVSQSYREGSFVKSGELLFSIDPLPFRAARLQAQGNLGQALAALEKADADVARYRPLVEKRAATREQLDNAVAAQHAAEGQIESAKAALKTAELNLGYTQITAPVDGIAGIAEVRVGNLVGQGSPTLLTIVSNVDPIRFVFQIGERAYLQYAERLKQLATAAPQANDDPARTVSLVLAGERLYQHQGVIAVVARQVDPTTGTLTLQALFPNPEWILRPGQYGRVRLSNELKDAVVVPQRAVQAQQGQNQVAVIDGNNKVELRSVRLGPTSGAFVVIEEGIRPGERTVIDGVQKVRAGQPVNPMPADTSSLPLSSTPVHVLTTLPPNPAVGGGPASSQAPSSPQAPASSQAPSSPLPSSSAP